MHNAFDFKDFEQRLLEALNKNEKFIKILKEEESAADKAKKMGLTSMGFGRWGKDDKVTHKTTDGKLEPVAASDEKEKDKKQTAPTGTTPPTDKTKKPKQAGTPSNKSGNKSSTNKEQKPEKVIDPEQQRAQAAMPKAKLSGKPLRAVPKEQLQQVATKLDDLARMGQEAAAKGENAPDFNLCQVSIPGTNLYCGDNKGIDRDDMPQFKGKARPGSTADSLPKDKKGEIDAEEFFKKMLEDKGIKVSDATAVPPDRLKATQKELVGTQVAGMMKALEANPSHPAITAPIYVSRDGYVLDGHHRWAAIVSYNASNPDKPIPMQVMVIDEDIEPLVKISNEFADEIGILPKNASTKKPEQPKAEPEKPKEEPKAEPEKPKAEPEKPKEEPKTEPTASTRPKFKPWPEPEKGLTRSKFEKIKDEAREFFRTEIHKGKTPERRSLVQAVRDKMKGVVAAVKKEYKHEKAVFRDAARGLRGFFKGKGPNERETDAIKSVAIKIVMTAALATGLGAAAGGAAALGKAVLVEFIPHVVGESLLKGVGRAALFAGAEDGTDDANMEKFIELVLKNMEEMDIPDEVIESAFIKYKGDK